MWLLVQGGATSTTRATGDAAGGRLGVDRVEGDIQRRKEDNSLGDNLVGVHQSYRGDNRYTFVLRVGDQRFEVNRSQYEAAPDSGRVAAYALAGTRRLVNLERLGPSAAEAAATSRAEAYGVRRDGLPAEAAVLDGAALQAAVVGRWGNERLRMTLWFRGDGTMAGPSGAGVWSVQGPGRLAIDEAVVHVATTSHALHLQFAEGPAIELRRIEG